MRGNISEIHDGGDLLLLGRYGALGKLPREMRQPLRASLMLRGMMKHPDAVRQVRLAWTEWYSHPQAGIVSDDEIYQMLDADLHRGKIQGVPIPHVRMSFESGKIAALQQAARPVGGRRGTSATPSSASASTSTAIGTATGQKPVSQWTTEERISAVIRRTVPKVPGRARQAMMGLLSPESIATMALTMGIVAAMNLTPYGWAADAVLAGVAFGFGGLAALEALGDLVECFRKTAGAQNEVDIELAATALAKAVVVFGALGLMAILHKISSRKGTGSPGEGEPDPVGPAKGAGGGRTGDSPSIRRAAPPKDEAPPPPPPKPKSTSTATPSTPPPPPPAESPPPTAASSATPTAAESAATPAAAPTKIDAFKMPKNGSKAEMERQLKEQQDKINSMSPDDLLANLKKFKEEGRPDDSAERQLARKKAGAAKQEEIYEQLLEDGLSPRAAKQQAAEEAEEWLSTKDATHDLDWVAGGDGTISGVGGSTENRSIGSQWKSPGESGEVRRDQLQQAAEKAKTDGKPLNINLSM